MTTAEFSEEFNLLYNNISSNAAPGLDEYEKSVFLTQAQEAVVISIYNGDSVDVAFEGTEEIKRYLDVLVKQEILTVKTTGLIGLSSSSVFYEIPPSVWFPVYEQVVFSDTTLGCFNNSIGLVKPISHDEYYPMLRNPFKGMNKRRVLRLTKTDNIVELISNYNIASYLVRYLVKPSPIILEDLAPLGVSIDGVTAKTECMLNPSIHRGILRQAVGLAKASWNAGN